MTTNMEQMQNIPVYQHSGEHAREHGELEQFRASNVANIACRSEIERNITAHFDGMSLNGQVVEPALNIFGAERVLHVLANTVQHLPWDGRFSHDNKAWAQTFDIPEDKVMDMDRRTQYVITSHPAILDGYIRIIRQAVQEREKSSVQSALQKPPQKSARPHPCKKDSQER